MKKILPLAILLLLAGCASSTQNTSSFTEFGKPLGNHYLTRPQRQAQLSDLQNWTASGNIAVRTEQKGWNASFNWQQRGQNYNLIMFGPLGINRVQLAGGPQGVTLQTGDQTYTAGDADQLLQQQLGWNIPVSNLYYWMRGLPATTSHARQYFDLNNHLVQLYQQGWHIIYLRYLAVNGIDMPNRILLTNAQLQAHIVITQWQL